MSLNTHHSKNAQKDDRISEEKRSLIAFIVANTPKPPVTDFSKCLRAYPSDILKTKAQKLGYRKS